jgi:hypothetical protein
MRDIQTDQEVIRALIIDELDSFRKGRTNARHWYVTVAPTILPPTAKVDVIGEDISVVVGYFFAWRTRWH